MSHDKLLEYEEEFHGNDRKTSRKEKKEAIENDRSKYKKTDQDQQKKNKPIEHEEPGIKGRILAIHPEGMMVECGEKLYRCQLKGSLKKEKNKVKNLVAVGDFVIIQERSHEEGLIVQIKPRYSYLSRADNLHRRKEQLIAVNIDQVIITISAHFPALKPALIDRYIIAAQKGNMHPVIVINKIDLLEKGSEEQELILECQKAYKNLNIPFLLISAHTGEGIEELKKIMQNKASVFSGQSGVGKSSLINAVTGSLLKTGEMAQKTFKGSHTTTTAQLIKMNQGGLCIDTPGIKSFGVWDLERSEIQLYFSEISNIALQCKFPNCSHQSESGCAVKTAVETGEISSIRFASYSSLIETLQQEHRNR